MVNLVATATDSFGNTSEFSLAAGIIGDPSCDCGVCTVADITTAVSQALGQPATAEADVNCSNGVNLFDLNCLVDCNLNREDHCLLSPCATGALPRGCGTAPPTSAAAAEAVAGAKGGSGEFTPVVVVSVNGLELPRGGEATSTVRVASAGRAVGGVSMAVHVPEPWIVTGVDALGLVRAIEPRFHQKGQTLRVLLVSFDGEPLAREDDVRVKVTLRRNGPQAWGADERIRLLEAEVIGEKGRRLRLELQE
jgi:hypothetical protein